MKENFNHKIQRLELENFTCFSKIKMDFSSGVNVFLGENGTGKTHVLKALYAMFQLDTRQDFFKEYENEGNALLVHIGQNFTDVFKTHAFFLKRHGKSRFNVKAKFSGLEYQFHGGKSFLDENKNDFGGGFPLPINFKSTDLLFIPNHEMLTLYDGFIAAYENRENSFDATYYKLAKALNAKPLVNSALEKANHLLADLKAACNFDVYKKDGYFFIKFHDEIDETYIAAVAEGLKKLAQMIYLIVNGSLTKNTILFWDEPETNLNPRYIKLIAQFLQTLAKNGVQIFVATHDYLLAHSLSTAAEYRTQTDAPPMRFFSFYKGIDGTEVETGATLAEIQNNSILDEYSAYFDLEQKLYDQKRLQSV